MAISPGPAEPDTTINPIFGRDTLPGLVTLSWTMAGGVVAGGFLVASVALSGGLRPSFIVPTAVALCIGGGLAGLVHGGALGYLGRRTDLPRSAALESITAGAFAAIPGGMATLGVGGCIALTAGWIATPRLSLFGTVLLRWALGALICGWAAWEGWRATRRAFARWPEYREGTALLLAVFAVLAVVFLSTEPRIWLTELHVSGLGAVILAAGATVWIALPVAVVVLHGVHQAAGRWSARRAH